MTGKKDFDMRGLREINAKINKAVGRLKKTSSRGLAAAAVFVAAEAAKRAPIESGDLRNSVYIKLDGKRAASGAEGVAGVSAEVGESAKIAEIGFASRYAVKQHEDMSLNHERADGYRTPAYNARTGKPNKTAGRSVNLIPGGQAKYLESVLTENEGRILKHIADAADLGGSND